MTPSPKNYLSLFSGCCGGDLAFQHLLEGFRCVGYVEWEKYCQDVIVQRIEDGLLDCAPVYGDIREFNREYAKEYTGMVDLITGGFPCQDISCAGKRKGIEGERSGLWSEMAEVVRKVKPGYVFVENTPEIVIRGLGTVLRDLAKMGYDAKWSCISTAETGGVHLRERFWLLATNTKCKINDRLLGVRPEVTPWNKISRKWCKDWEQFELVDRKVAPRQWRDKRQHPLSRPLLIRKNDETSNILDRHKAVGNAQDPIVAATAWEILS